MSLLSTVYRLPSTLLVHLRTPLYRNGYALLLSAAASSGLGMVYWLLAAHFYPAATVGLNAAAIAALMLLSGLSQFSLNSALVRFLPEAGGRAHRFVGFTYLVSLAIAAALGLLFSRGLAWWAPALRSFLEPPIAVLLFTLSIMVWSIFALQDSVLTGLRQTAWVPVENVLVAVGKIVLLWLFATPFPVYGLFAAWIIPAAVSLLPVNLLLFWRLIPQHAQNRAGRYRPRLAAELIRYLLGNYVGVLFFLAATTLLPLLVTNLAGASANAYFSMPWLIATALQLIAVNLTTSLTVEVTHDEQKLSVYCYRIFVQGVRILAPLVLLLLIASTPILRSFGDAYAAEGATLLRLLALAALPNLLVMLYISLARIQNRAGDVMLVQGALCLLLLGLSYWWLPVYGIKSVGFAALISQGVVAALILLTRLRPILSQGRLLNRSNRDGNR